MSTEDNKAKVRRIIEEDWIIFDAVGMLQQLSVVPVRRQS